MALAIYRRYRPQKLADVLGQEAITDILRNAARLDRLSHAYLFYGPRGSGKTTTARIIAKIANCEKRKNDAEFKKQGEPCNECWACKQIESGHSFDVIEIDAASNRGIDEIRNLKENIRLAPASLQYKVYIIDECHQLTKEAFNALLKTLEEPPEHAILILVTTEFEKMPITITSRTQRFNFKKLTVAKIAEKLKEVVKVENIKANNDAIDLIASAAEGSFRDAESILDQIANLKTEINLGDVENILGRVGFSRTAELAEFLIKNDLSSSLNYLSKISDGGYNLVQFCKDLIHYLRRVLVLKFNPALEKNFSREMTDLELNTIKKHSQMINAPKTIGLIKSLIRAYTEMRYSPFAIVPLEVAIIENLKS